MTLKYIYQEDGKKTAVIIPIEEWLKIQHLLNAHKKSQQFDPKVYRGFLKHKGEDVEKELQKLREEWKR